MEQIKYYLSNSITNFRMPIIRITDVIEILIIAYLIYKILAWARTTRLLSLLRGILVILVFIILAAVFNMTTILWIVSHVLSIAVIAMVVVLQPELRKALEQLGRQQVFSRFLSFEAVGRGGRFSDRTKREISRACVEMGKVRTGALIVIGRDRPLTKYENTGIGVDAIVSSQLLINIFEHNTPLHDGAVLIQGDRIVSATCYLPLSENSLLGKELGTRHRAGVGISEVTDAMTLIVSEETGKISIAQGGLLEQGLDGDCLIERLTGFQEKPVEDTRKNRKGFRWKNGSGQPTRD